jgi:hypothetical protein
MPGGYTTSRYRVTPKRSGLTSIDPHGRSPSSIRSHPRRSRPEPLLSSSISRVYPRWRARCTVRTISLCAVGRLSTVYYTQHADGEDPWTARRAPHSAQGAVAKDRKAGRHRRRVVTAGMPRRRRRRRRLRQHRQPGPGLRARTRRRGAARNPELHLAGRQDEPRQRPVYRATVASAAADPPASDPEMPYLHGVSACRHGPSREEGTDYQACTVFCAGSSPWAISSSVASAACSQIVGISARSAAVKLPSTYAAPSVRPGGRPMPIRTR